MATIDVTRNHSLSVDAAKMKAEELAKGLTERLGIVWKWEGDTIHFEAPGGIAKGVKGRVAVSEKTLRVTIELPFMLSVMKGKIEGKVNENLDTILGAS